MQIVRANCAICDGQDFKEIARFSKFPVWMGAVPQSFDNAHYQYCDLVYSVCTVCNELQIGEMIDLAVLYQDNHNVDMVGEIWRQHFEELAGFIKKHVESKKVLEIGDPSGKLARLCVDRFEQWNIIEPNPSYTEIDKVNWIKGFFGTTDVPDVSCIVHSHLLEHLYNPLQFLKDCYDRLPSDGKMIFSVPDMEYTIMRYHNPVLSLNFEHTYYLDVHNLRSLLFRSGFKVDAIEKYGNHSLFFACSKDEKSIYACSKTNLVSTDRFKNHLRNQAEKIERICMMSDSHQGDIFLYQCHVTSQFLLCAGLPESRICHILDNSSNKNAKKLYGTNLVCRYPESIRDADGLVITSHTGIYKKEIEQQLTKISQKVGFC